MLVSTYASKDTLKKYQELWNKIRDIITSVANMMTIMMKDIRKSNFNQMMIYL